METFPVSDLDVWVLSLAANSSLRGVLPRLMSVSRFKLQHKWNGKWASYLDDAHDACQGGADVLLGGIITSFKWMGSSSPAGKDSCISSSDLALITCLSLPDFFFSCITRTLSADSRRFFIYLFFFKYSGLSERAIRYYEFNANLVLKCCFIMMRSWEAFCLITLFLAYTLQ